MTSKGQKLRFIHTSDLQLGMTRHFLSSEAQARFTQDRIDAIRTIGQLATEREADFVVVAGDVFESNHLTRQTVVRAVDALQSLPVPVFLLPGNHDPLDASSLFNTAPFVDQNSNVTVIRDSAPVQLPGRPDIEVVGAPWTSKRPVTDICGAMLDSLSPTSGVVRVAVAHGQVDRLSPDITRPDVIDLAKAEQALTDGRISYLALGDRHSATAVGESGAVWYSGAPVATDFDEVRPNQALLVEIAKGAKPTVEELPVGQWHFIRDEKSIHDSSDVAQVREWLDALPDKERTVLKIAFTGTVNIETAGELDAVLADFGDHFASLRQWDRKSDWVVAPDALDENSIALSGYAKRAWDELIGNAKDEGDDASEAQDALALFYRLAREGAE
ncbi:MAG TPA: exonuclease SbcCD subunit D [Gammaproteobacteria bacterium]|nr:exonuclease SbcCD subunit D [Gammaproteobacteria bacterium]